jgi:class 3 adenylate cyclase/tetratricopeptide (TPR) repeat protein
MLACPNCGRESPDEFAFCPACASPLTAGPLEREVRKTVTVVFCDVTGSTALGERLDPESLRDVQSRYFEAMRRAIERHGGTVEKYIGDAVMAVFGIPQLHEDDALRAVRAAVEMREGLAALNEELGRDRGVTLEVRIGVNTGEVVAGDPTAGQALVTGDAVNVAARLEQHTAPGGILVGDETHRLLRDVVEAEPVDPLALKGKSELVAAWRLLGVRDVPGAIPRSLGSPMVGRRRQLAQLRQGLDAVVEDRTCQLVTVFGSAGVGKSRLVEEFLSGLDGGATVLTGRCLPYGEGITYHPVVESIKQAAGLADFDPPEVVESKVCAVLATDEHQELVCSRVSQLMGIADAGAGEETFWAIRRFYEAVARERPLVLVFDDVQWGEPTFLDLLDHVADWSGGSPILLVCMARPDLLEARPAWGGGKLRASSVSLEPLTEQQTADLIGNLLGVPQVADELFGAIAGRAEGNPLFVEETIAMLIDDGRLVRKDGGWRATDELFAVTVPPSIQALLAARLDRLSPEERLVLEAAAVIGRDAFAGAVRELVPQDARERVPSDLMGLMRKELIQPIPTTLRGEDAFRFRHLLIRDAAYDAVAKSRRAELHERFADWLERVAGEAVSEEEEIVAYHLERAFAYRRELGPADARSDALGRRAALRLGAAGRRAAARGDQPAAVGLLSRAASVGPDRGAERAWTLYHLGVELQEAGDEPAALAALDEAVLVAESADDRSLAWRARIARTEVQTELDPRSIPTATARAEIVAAIEALTELGDEAGLADAWTKLGFIEFMPCRFDQAARAEGRAVAYARACGDDRLLFDALRLQMLSESYGSTTPDEGLRRLDALGDDARRSRPIDVAALAIRSRYLSMRGEVQEARRTIELAVAAAEAVGMRFFVAICEGFRGELEYRAGDLDAAERARRRGYEILDATGHVGIKTTHAAELATYLARLGRLEEAERFAAIGRTAAEDDLSSQSIAGTAETIVLAARGDLEGAEDRARAVVTMVADAEWPAAQGDARMELARVLRAAGRPSEAEQASREALALYERKGDRPSVGAAMTFLDELGP